MSDLSPVPASSPAPSGVPAADSPTSQPNAESPIQGDKPSAPPNGKTYTEEEHRKAIQEAKGKEARRAERIATERVRREYAEQEAARLRAELETARGERKPTNTQQGSEPQPDDFKTPQEWLKAWNRWDRDQADSETREKRERESATEREERQQEARAKALRDKLADGPKKYEDWKEVTEDDDAPITRAMAKAIEESDRPIDLTYYLCHPDHRDEAMKIAEMPVTRQIREIAKIEAKLAAPPAPTKAPPPIVPGGGNATAGKDYGRMTTAEHIADYQKRNRR